MNRMSATKMTLFRPHLSASTLASGLANRANRLVQEVMRLLSSVVSGCDRSVPTETRVEEITPVLLELESDYDIAVRIGNTHS